MAIRKIGRDPEGIESLKLYASLTPQQALGTDLQDQARQEEFAGRVRRAVSGSVQTPTRLHGLRVEALFRAMLVALGGFTLLTDVDGGEPYFDDAGGPVKLPDFSIVDRDGQQLLVEVKSVSPRRDPLKPHTISKTEMLGLQRYGKLMNAPVAMAHYWTAWNRWTLVPLDRLTPIGKRYGIGLQEAFAANELSRFGDCLVGTRPPLTFVLNVEPTTTARPPAASQVRVTGVEVSAAGVVLEDDREANIAWYLMRFGDWPTGDPQMRFEDSVPRAIEISVAPPPENRELVEQQGFAGIGMLSSLYSSLYNELTLTPDGEVRELRHEPDPGELAALIPDDYWDRKDRALSLWRFHIEPPASE